MVTLAVATDNIKFFLSLVAGCPVTNLYVSADFKVSFDTRVLKSIRRYYDGSSRNDLITPIEESFSLAMNTFSPEDLSTAVENVSAYLKVLYSESPYNQIFKTVIRQIKLNILDTKTYSKALLITDLPADPSADPPAEPEPLVPIETEIQLPNTSRRCRNRRRH